ncbi:hypothetical protein FACS1894219_03350 [Clostridia bacterium]|nr:hypothetical protein FACS1894219_03350 [Clostridia bacterium]
MVKNCENSIESAVVTATNHNQALAGDKNVTHDVCGKQIIEIPLSELFSPEFHPFEVRCDEAMQQLAESVQRYGVREPGIVRKRPGGGYELLCGNRRKHACEIAGITTLPVVVHELTDDEAVIVMIDSNLERRERILPSERALAYKLKMDALNHSGVKGERYSCDIVTAQTGLKKNQIYRFIRLTELIDALSDKADRGQIAFNPAVELSYLSVREQSFVADAMEKYQIKPSLSQAVRLKKLKQSGRLTVEIIDRILSEEKKPLQNVPKDGMRFRKYFPPEYSAKQIEEVIVELVKSWKRREVRI